MLKLIDLLKRKAEGKAMPSQVRFEGTSRIFDYNEDNDSVEKLYKYSKDGETKFWHEGYRLDLTRNVEIIGADDEDDFEDFDDIDDDVEKIFKKMIKLLKD